MHRRSHDIANRHFGFLCYPDSVLCYDTVNGETLDTIIFHINSYPYWNVFCSFQHTGGKIRNTRLARDSSPIWNEMKKCGQIYPGVESSPFHGFAKAQMPKCFFFIWKRQQAFDILIGLWYPPIKEYRWTHSLTHWGRVTHICVGKQTIIGSDNGLSPGRRQAII